MPAQSFATLLVVFTIGGVIASVGSSGGAIVGVGIGLYYVLLLCNRLDARDKRDAQHPYHPRAPRKHR